MTANDRTAIGKMMDCILRDVALWEREHCETPERIFVSPRLHAMLKANASIALQSNAEAELFGIPLSVYHPGDRAELGFYLAAGGRRFASLEEDLQ